MCIAPAYALIVTMDSKTVDRLLREQFWPPLKQAGFHRRSGRTAWRDDGNAVQCVNVHSFNSYVAGVMGATTFSFGVTLGVFYEAIASRSAMGGFVKDYARPKEYECHLRKFLTKGLSQPNVSERPWLGIRRSRPTLGPWVERLDVWLVLSDGSNVEACVRDAGERVMAGGLPWLEAVSRPREAIRRLFEEPDIFDGPEAPKEIYGGAIGSPARWQAIGALAAAGGDWELVSRAIEAMSAQDAYRARPADLDRLRDELITRSG
jgi:Domain of unknown function (DUF4304)